MCPVKAKDVSMLALTAFLVRVLAQKENVFVSVGFVKLLFSIRGSARH